MYIVFLTHRNIVFISIKKLMITQKYLDELTYEVLGASIEVHKIIGKGLLESIYHQCLKEELSQRKLNFFTEMKVPILYKEKELFADFRCD